MSKRLTLLGVTMTITLFVTCLYGQGATEIYIPLGKSPGISGVKTIVGSIDEIDEQQHQMSVSNASGTYKVAITGDTKIWLDKSKINGRNEAGSPADCKPGLKVEVKYTADRLAESVTAEWIKVEVTN